jgi:hypothetical protein
MAGDVLETDSMQQTEDETRKADWASRIQGWTVVATQTRRRRATRKGCVSKQLRITAAQENALTPAPARTTILTGRDPPHAGRACTGTGTGTGTGLFSSLVFRDGSASREARAWRGWQPIEGEVHGEKVQISAVCIKVGMTENAPRVHASSALGARVQWLAF